MKADTFGKCTRRTDWLLRVRICPKILLIGMVSRGGSGNKMLGLPRPLGEESQRTGGQLGGSTRQKHKMVMAR